MDDFVQIVRKRVRAIETNDRHLLSSLLHPSYIYLTHTGIYLSKEGFLASFLDQSTPSRFGSVRIVEACTNDGVGSIITDIEILEHHIGGRLLTGCYRTYHVLTETCEGWKFIGGHFERIAGLDAPPPKLPWLLPGAQQSARCSAFASGCLVCVT